MARTTNQDSRLSANGLSPIRREAAGIDIGATFHVAAIGGADTEESVRTFKSFTADLHCLADWLVDAGITTVAMESTGIYWIPVFEILEARGLEVFLVNARDVKTVPGRKTDVNDAQWLQKLHEYGLLRASFRPRAEIATLREYLRQRERLVEYSAAHIQHMQKALMQMNVQLHHVVSTITGVTGMGIVRAILDGETDPAVLAGFRDVRCKASAETIEHALTGSYRAEHLFALRHAVELYDTYQAKIVDCDREIEAALARLCTDRDEPAIPLPKPRHRTRQKNEPSFDVRATLYAVLGVDLTQIHGIGPSMAMTLIAECGDDMTKWPTQKHFTSWLCLSPGNKISGGRVLSSRTRRTSNRATTLFRIAAMTVGRTDTALGAFYRRLSARAGKAKAVTATARKIAVLFYRTLADGLVYTDQGAGYYDEKYRQRVVASMRKRAYALGFEMIPAPPSSCRGVS